MFSPRTPFAVALCAIVLGLASSRPMDAQPAYLVKDIQTSVNPGVGLNPYGFVTSGSLVYFVGSDLVHGDEIWRTDGTAAGTFMLRDFVPGDAFSPPGSWTDFGGMLFFTVSDPSVGSELWKSDGTTAGTVLVKDINPGPSSSGPGSFAVLGGTLFFAARDPVNGTELWKTDGTAAGTVLVKDINPGSGDSTPNQLTVSGGLVFFEAYRFAENNELWASDGTTAGTVLVKDIRLGLAPSFVDHLTDVNGTLFFNANDGTWGKELWKSDGTAAGTVMVRDIYTGSSSSDPKALMELNGNLLFTASSSGQGRELWTSDGTAVGTVMVKDIRPGFGHAFPPNDPPRFTKAGTTAYFVAEDDTSGAELWKSDGTGPGTTMVIDLCPGTCSSLPTTNAAGLDKMILAENAGQVLFSADDTTGLGEELYRTNGTAVGTALVKDICPGVCTPLTSIYTFWVASLGGSLYFHADDGTNGHEVWKSDGTGPGTVMVKNLTTTSSLPDSLTFTNNLLFFTANDGVAGDELWRSDGTEPGTTRLSDIFPGVDDSSPQELTKVGSTLFFTADDGGNLRRELYKSDGTVPGTVLVSDIHSWPGWSSNPEELTDVNGTLFLAAEDETLFGVELWKSNGTDAGTTMVKDINPGSTDSNPTWLTNVNGTLFFTANDGTNGTEIWKSDGTTAGTVLVKDLYPGGSSSSPFQLTAVGATLYFGATGPGGVGRELFKSDGTDAGTVLVKEICPGSCGAFTNILSQNFLVDVNGVLFFTADDGVNGRELWKSDGTSAGTVMVLDIRPGADGSSPFSLVEQNGLVYFGATDGVSGRELWQSDGTPGGTVRVTDVNPGAGTALPFSTPVAGAGQEVLFAATNASSGVELWKSAGSMPTTLLVQDIAPGSPASLPSRFTPGSSLFFFTADDGSGEEVWALPQTDVSVTKTDSSDPVTVNQSFIYTLTVTNEGPNIAHAVTVTDTLPVGMNFVSSTPPTCTDLAGTVTCTVVDIPSGSSEQVQIEVLPTAVASFTNEAAAVAGEIDPDIADNETTESTNVLAGCSGTPAFGGLTSITTAGACDAILSWNAASGACPGSLPIFYNVYRSTTPGFTPGLDTLVAPCLSATSYVDTLGLEPDTTYYYVVRAEDSNFAGGGRCQNGNEDTNFVELSQMMSGGCSTAPDKVPVLTVTSTNETNKLNWVNPPTGSALTIRYSDVSQPATETDGNALVPLTAFTPNDTGSFNHTTLNNDTTYYYSAFAFNGTDKYSGGTESSGRPEDTLDPLNPVEWIYSTSAATLTPPGVGAGIAYVVSNDNALHAMNYSDGDWPPGWRIFHRMEQPSQGRPNVIPLPLAGANRVIFPGSQDGHVYAVDAESGKLLWRNQLTLERVQASPGGMFTGYLGLHDLVMVGTRNTADNIFYALDPNTGAVAWYFDNGGGIGAINAQAVIDYQNRRVFFTSFDGGSGDTLWCLEFDAASVNLKWSKPFTNISASPILYRDRLYVGTDSGIVLALNPVDGSEYWNKPLGDGLIKGFVWPEGVRLYVSTTNNVWELHDLDTMGWVEWSQAVPGPSIPLVAMGTSKLYVGGGDGNLYELDRTSSPPTVKTQFLGGVVSTVGAPALDVPNQLIYVGTSLGRVYAVKFPLP